MLAHARAHASTSSPSILTQARTRMPQMAFSRAPSVRFETVFTSLGTFATLLSDSAM